MADELALALSMLISNPDDRHLVDEVAMPALVKYRDWKASEARDLSRKWWDEQQAKGTTP
jgi:hypothetical protein